MIRSRSVPPPTPVIDGEEDEGEEIQAPLGRDQRARDGEHGDAEIIEQDERGRDFIAAYGLH